MEPTTKNTSQGIPAATLPNSLTGLSPEARNRVYGHLLHGDDKSRVSSLSLMRVSRQLHVEVGSHHYANEVFRLKSPTKPEAGANILPPINDRYVRFLKDISIEFRVGAASLSRTKETAKTIKHLTTIGANFSTIWFVIEFPLEMSRFLSARLDDAILDSEHPITAALQHLLESGVSKAVYVVMNRAWFATGVATVIKDRYGDRLQFRKTYGDDTILEPARYETPLTGVTSPTMVEMFNHDDEEVVEDSSSTMIEYISESLDLVMMESDADVVESEAEDSLAFPTDEEDDYMECSEEMQEHDDDKDDDDNDLDDVSVDLDDLIPLEDGEADAIMSNWNVTKELRENEEQTEREIGFLVNFAPDMLSRPPHDA